MASRSDSGARSMMSMRRSFSRNCATVAPLTAACRARETLAVVTPSARALSWSTSTRSIGARVPHSWLTSRVCFDARMALATSSAIALIFGMSVPLTRNCSG